MRIAPNIITGLPTLLAPGRAGRPHAFSDASTDEAEECPFCPGQESSTPPTLRAVEKDGRWLARAFANKYPASKWHEVVVDSPRHDATFDVLEDAAAVLELYIARYAALSQSGAEYVCLFKNHGPMAGASIQHAHSQLLGVPFLPPRLERESAAFAAALECPLCAAMASHRDEGLVIDENDSFVWLAPSGSVMANQQWLVPKRHQNEVSSLDRNERRDLGALLQSSTSAMKRVSASFNWLFMNFPRQNSAHFYVDVFPRRTAVAGFELATGTFIEVVEPATTARLFRAR